MTTTESPATARTGHGAPGARVYDVAIVGAGLAGLTAAATAARFGARVVLLDGRDVGGRARSAARDGFVLNEGGHALYRSGGGWDALVALGVEPRGAVPPLGDSSTVWDGAIVPLPVVTRDILTSRLLSVRSKAKLARWFGDLARTARSAGDRSFEEWLTDQRAGADLRRYALTVARLSTYAADPGRLPPAAVLRQFLAGGDGVVYLDGGWKSLVEALRGVAVEAAAEIVTGATVAAVEPAGSDWTVVADDRGVDAATVVLAAGGPAVATRLLGGDPAGWVERAGPELRASCLDIGGDTDGDHQLLLSSDEPLYCSRHAPVARLAPDGAHLHSVMRYLAPDDPNTAEQNRAALERHATAAGLPAGDDRRLERFLAAPVVSWGSPQVGIERPTGVELEGSGLFAAGDWVGDALLADASIRSGVVAGTGAARRATVSR